MTDACPTTLIEPNRLFRDGLKHLLAGTRFAVSAEFSTPEQALAQADAQAAPGLLITGQANLTAEDLQGLRGTYPAAKIVVLADQVTLDGLRDAMAAGIDGFLVKSVSPEALVQSLQLILVGETVFPTNLAALLTEMSPPAPHGTIRGISPREQDILLQLVLGASNKAIGNRLGITEATVKVHLKTLLRKIDVNNRTQAAIWAMNNGFSAEGVAAPARILQALSA